MISQKITISDFFTIAIVIVCIFCCLGCGNKGESNFELAIQESSKERAPELSTRELVKAIRSLEKKIETLNRTMKSSVPPESKEVVGTLLDPGLRGNLPSRAFVRSDDPFRGGSARYHLRRR